MSAITQQPFDTVTALKKRYSVTRRQSLSACESLCADDFNLQAEAFISPPKWHLAHTSWFFETFILKPFSDGYQTPDPIYEVIFNSYYNGVGKPFARGRRGLLSRPTVDQVLAYREWVDQHMLELLEDQQHRHRRTIEQRCRLGIEHEQQHQELFYTDIKYSFYENPVLPVFQKEEAVRVASPTAKPVRWHSFDGGLVTIGVDERNVAFSYDNEGPEHQCYLQPYAIGDRLVTNHEYQAFIDDGGYQRSELWLADGWAHITQEGWQAPLYWQDDQEYTLNGLRQRRPDDPVTHLSGFEADAFATWAGCRLPTEAEWEHAARQLMGESVLDNATELHPKPADRRDHGQWYTDCWQWTGSAYRPYPGFKPASGAIGEYNGKFMCNQWILRGASCVTAAGHSRPSYRNFFYPHERWQFSGVRLAKDIQASKQKGDS
ncbi:Hercynine oxygenase [BD1-7 clade bacterium]|uniref:Hercynine oxygenase n=1 Tax=BD1-7 clade bacterium TaxID=2029982 RepID=A0A5S9QKP2_9GAMM|nr:Hercynine oxygenase [BD1-7 clade bacterium]CAA0118946.1 Hercynine oxygenase [BD1-7 clade bacterium]